MVKKKGSEKKKNAKKIAASNVPKPSSAKLESVFRDISKEFFLVQICDLEKKISRYQEKCDTLDLRNKEVEENFVKQTQDKEDIVSFLKIQLEEKSAELEAFKKKIEFLEKQAVLEKQNYEQNLLNLKETMQDVKDQLISENMILTGKLAALDDFRVQKEDILKSIAEKDELIRMQEQKYNEELYQIERKAVIDKDRLKKEMVLRVNNVASEFREVSNKQMADTTKRTIRENVVINSQLVKMSDQAVELISENDDLKLRLKKQKEQLNIFENTEKELITKNISNLKVIRILTEKAKEQDVLLQQFDFTEKEHIELKTKYKELIEQLENQKNQFTLLLKDNTVLMEKQEKLQSDNKCLTEDKEYLVGVLTNACEVIKHSLQHDSLEDGTYTTDEQLRANVLFNLIEILNLAAKLGVGFELPDLSKNRKCIKAKQLFTSQSMRRSLTTASLNSPPSFSHYRAGDLGFVPAASKTANADKLGLNGSKNAQCKKKILYDKKDPAIVTQPACDLNGANKLLTKS